ncbi:MAG: glycosyltransferase [Opitutaceae bacterium]|nr:glycosyltransferase [Opitutaceae bacterium]
MDTPPTRPLLSLSIAAYKQEPYIRAAIEGAFAQTYSPLEIILSDDCSPDRTFDIMQEMAGRYSGPHRIILNRNPKNLGLARHVNRLFALANGEVFIGSAGDDISLPHRVEATWRVWEKTQRRATGIHSTLIRIDHHGNRTKSPPAAATELDFCENGQTLLSEYLRCHASLLTGASAAWARVTYEAFGPIPDGIINEDMVLSFRAMLSGGIALIHEPLVLYRCHENNLHNSSKSIAVDIDQFRAEEARRLTIVDRELAVARAFRSDLSRALELKLLTREAADELARKIDHYETSRRLERSMLTSSWPASLWYFLRLGRRVQQLRGTSLARAATPRALYFTVRRTKHRLLATKS